jgi:hypothetical protein
LANTVGINDICIIMTTRIQLICVYCVYKNLVKIYKCEAYAIDYTAMITPIIFCRDTLRYLAFLCPFTNGFQKYGVNEIQTTMMNFETRETLIAPVHMRNSIWLFILQSKRITIQKTVLVKSTWLFVCLLPSPVG